MPASGNTPSNSNAPYGTEPRRGNTPIYLLGTLYGLWFCGLIWLAFFYHPK